MFQIEFRFLAIKNIKKRKLRMRFEIVLQISKNYYQLFEKLKTECNLRNDNKTRYE